MLRPSISPMSVGVDEVTRHLEGSHVELDVLTLNPKSCTPSIAWNLYIFSIPNEFVKMLATCSCVLT